MYTPTAVVKLAPPCSVSKTCLPVHGCGMDLARGVFGGIDIAFLEEGRPKGLGARTPRPGNVLGRIGVARLALPGGMATLPPFLSYLGARNGLLPTPYWLGGGPGS